MSEVSNLQNLMEEASGLERAFDWVEAAEVYKKALALDLGGTSTTGSILEASGYALYLAAMQARGVDEFRDRVQQASSNYERARDFYAGLGGLHNIPRALRCSAFIAFLGYWLAAEVSERKRLLDNCWAQAREALNGFELAGDASQYATTYNRLLMSAVLSFELDRNFQTRRHTMKEAAERGEKAVSLFSTNGEADELARTHANAANSLRLFGSLLVPDEREHFRQKALGHYRKAVGFSEEAAVLELWDYMLWGSGADEALTSLELKLECGRKRGNKLIVGSALEQLAYHTLWKALLAENPDERLQLRLRGLRHAEEAKEQYSSTPWLDLRSPVSGGEPADHLWSLALDETSLNKRRELLQKALEGASDYLKRAERAGCPSGLSEAHNVLSKILTSLAQIETDPDERKRLLEQALPHREEAIRILDQILPFRYFNRGALRNYLADLKSQLAGFAADAETREEMLMGAARVKEASLKLCASALPIENEMGDHSGYERLGSWGYQYGDMLNHLYEISNEKRHLKAAAAAFLNAAESFQKVDHISRMAECYWKTAQAYDLLEEHLRAAENFEFASNAYKASGKKILQLEALYRDHALYMEAWTEIEKAKHHHLREDYAVARGCYEKAASLHETTNQWNFLAPDYAAWAQVENAENLSRREQSQEAGLAFQRAEELFQSAGKSLETALGKVETSDLRQMVKRLLQVAKVRREYCRARVLLEDAKILDRKGDHYSSSEKFGLATETFQEIVDALESDQDKREFLLIIVLSRAWEKMTLAEAKASAELYREASRLFEEARDLTKNERGSLLALGHSRFCKALGAGTRFADTRDPNQYAASVKNLESAANYYLRAGFEHAAEHVEATKLLLGAYSLMDRANREDEHEKRGKLFTVAEKLLQSSAEAYGNADQPGKKEQALRFLERVRRERELVVSLAELMTLPSILSTTSAFATPMPTHERPVGLERFESADVRASVIVGRRDVRFGEKLSIEIELVNAGKGLAQLVKIDNLVPAGLEIVEKPQKYSLANGSLNLSGKRLGPLKTEEIRFQARANTRGIVPVAPNIHYLDEAGAYKLCRLEPAEIVVREPHIPEWLKELETTRFPPEFQFETERARMVFVALAEAFRDDYVSKGLFIEKAGWRSLMQLIRESGLPRSALYGPGGRRGPVLGELERLGLVELRVFPEERGRGGAITRARLAYENVILKHASELASK